tara:strand:- start:1006 stop:1971 length:966 start_codon:yes stop_codon:yes gene_type:complete
LPILTGEDTLKSVREIYSSDSEMIIAAAYWGRGALEHLGLNRNRNSIRIVLNAAHGGTNPEALAALMEAFPDRVRVNNTLHAKIYATENVALVGSSNASNAGLWFVGAGHSEASVLIEGKDAASAFQLAEQFYEEGHPATEADVNLCRERFGRAPLAATVAQGRAGLGGRPTLAEVFTGRDDVFGSLPVIIASGTPNENELEQDWSNLGGDADPEAVGQEYNGREWTYYQWNLSELYRGQLCVELYMTEGGDAELYLVQPLHQTGTGVFARRLTWLREWQLGQGWHGTRRLVQAPPDFQNIHEHLNEQDFIVGWNVIEALQ